jgi:radical SAM/Cys-rich protein
MLDTSARLLPTTFPAVQRDRLTTLQVNLGYLCNQQCQHCHVNAGPKRTEVMQRDTIDAVIRVLRSKQIETLDLTGGAPELNPYFRDLVCAAQELGVHVIDRCNLTILNEPGQESLAQFLAGQQVEVIASMPCYLAGNVDQQRGKGVFDGSIQGLQKLNALGYGQPDTGLLLNLVYNPVGPYLPPSQAELATDYRQKLAAYGISFNGLFTIANMPIQRFGSMLASKGEFDDYLDLLKSAHQASNIAAVMCRRLVSVDWQGYLYDCDFNQMLNMPLVAQNKPMHIADLQPERLVSRQIAVAEHCYGCTAGQGSSCSGALEALR